MANRILKAAIAGLGRIAWSTHLPEMKKHPDIEIAAVCDPLENVRNEAAEAFGVPGKFANLAEMLEKARPDLLVIATPTCFHAQHAVMALEAGCHVLCDKPAAMNNAEYRTMLDAAVRNNRVLEIYQPRRFNSDLATMKHIIEKNIIGKVYQIKVFAGNYVRRNDWQAFKRNGGGMLFNYGSHYVDQFIHLLGRDYKLRGCSTRRILSLGDADDVVKLLLDFKGVDVDIDINQAAAYHPYQYVMYGEYGSAVLKVTDGALKWHLRYYAPEDAPAVELQTAMAAKDRQYPRQAYEFKEEILPPVIPIPPGEFYYNNLYNAITAGEALINPPEDTMTLTTLLDKAEAMAAE